MKLITRDTDYAIRALCYIAKHKKEVVTAKELVGKLKIPRPFLRKIMQILNKEGILKSYKGRVGGFKLATVPARIYILDLMEVFQGPFVLNEHVFINSPCPHSGVCKLKRKVDKIEFYIKGELGDITLKDLL